MLKHKEIYKKYSRKKNFKDYIFTIFIFLANKRIVFNLNNTELEGVPDGMTIDRNGNLWIALFGGHHVSIYYHEFKMQ